MRRRVEHHAHTNKIRTPTTTHTHARTHPHPHTHARTHTHTRTHPPPLVLLLRRIELRLDGNCASDADLFTVFRSLTIFTSDQILGLSTSSRKTFMFLTALAMLDLLTSGAGIPLSKNLCAGNFLIWSHSMGCPMNEHGLTKTKCGPDNGNLWLRDFFDTPRFQPTLPTNRISHVSPLTDQTMPGAARWVPSSIPARWVPNTRTRVKIQCRTNV